MPCGFGIHGSPVSSFDETSSRDTSIYSSEDNDQLQRILDILSVKRSWCPRSREEYDSDIRAWEKILISRHPDIKIERLKYAIYHFCPKAMKRKILRMDLLSMPYKDFKGALARSWPFLESRRTASIKSSSERSIARRRETRYDVRVYADEFEEEMCNIGEFNNEWLARHGVFYDERVQIFFRHLPRTIQRRLMEEPDLERFTWDELRLRVICHYHHIYERRDRWSCEIPSSSLSSSECLIDDDDNSPHQWDTRSRRASSSLTTLPPPIDKCLIDSMGRTLCIECYQYGHTGDHCPVKTYCNIQCDKCKGAHDTQKCRAWTLPRVDGTPGFAIHLTNGNGYHVKFIGDGSPAKSARRLAYQLMTQADRLNEAHSSTSSSSPPKTSRRKSEVSI